MKTIFAVTLFFSAFANAQTIDATCKQVDVYKNGQSTTSDFKGYSLDSACGDKVVVHGLIDTQNGYELWVRCTSQRVYDGSSNPFLGKFDQVLALPKEIINYGNFSLKHVWATQTDLRITKNNISARTIQRRLVRGEMKDLPKSESIIPAQTATDCEIGGDGINVIELYEKLSSK